MSNSGETKRYKKRTTDDRKRQVATTYDRYGADHYRTIGLRGANWVDKEKARTAALKRWHPNWFDEDGKLLPEYGGGKEQPSANNS